MELSEWLNAFGLGVIIGGIFGYIVRFLQNIKEDLDEIQQFEKEAYIVRAKDERGISESHHINRVALGIVILLTAYAAWVSGQAADRAEDSVKQSQASIDTAASLAIKLDAVVACNTKYVKKTLRALSGRTAYSGKVTDANLKLQKAQGIYLDKILDIPPPNNLDARAAIVRYRLQLERFVSASESSKTARRLYPYPNAEQLSKCIQDSTSATSTNTNGGEDAGGSK
jgi:hypothetical protein